VTRARAGLLLFVAALALTGCGGSQKKVAAPPLPPAVPQAVNKMEQGVVAAKQPSESSHAIELFRSALKTDPNLWEARYNLGILLAQSGDLPRAERQLALAFKLAPNAEDIVVALGEVRRRLDDPKGAVDVLQRFVEGHPTAIVARTALVGALRESGQIDDAIKQAREVLVRRPNDPNALAELALAHLDRGEVDTAELLSEESLKAKHPTAVAERTAGLIALKRGSDAIAFKDFELASQIDPKDTTARLNIGTVLLEAGVYDRAAEQFKGVLAVKPNDIPATLGLAAALRGQGSRKNTAPYSEAEKLLKSILAREPENLAATYNLAILYDDFLQQPQQAKPLFQSFLANAPDSHPGRALAQKKLAAIK
jgi:tetratricopeptide (TPR) repeat protein